MRRVRPLPQQGLCVPQPLDKGPQMTPGTCEQAVTGRLLKAGLVLASEVSGVDRGRAGTPACTWRRGSGFPAPTGISPLWLSGDSSVPCGPEGRDEGGLAWQPLRF